MDPEEGKAIENGNLDIRIPINLPGKEGDALGREEEDEVVGAGNPDIRVPESVKREEGLCARRIRKEKNAEVKENEERRMEIAGSEGD
ncbi:hypothetical protein NDU88_004348 [Pleurodeles waltl]|uniref:Uncharacterized protein n=1 Tax=Pleurodeles waltl TaxID=8319 RepID=A0AAV7NKT8_PLEWA|nr:hypothetical protein NDU88_004348 [Pleurodeles waltl]